MRVEHERYFDDACYNNQKTILCCRSFVGTQTQAFRPPSTAVQWPSIARASPSRSSPLALEKNSKMLGLAVTVAFSAGAWVCGSFDFDAQHGLDSEVLSALADFFPKNITGASPLCSFDDW